MRSAEARIDLYWIPLGSGGHVVRWNGKAYEAIKALGERRSRLALYHSALEVCLGGSRYVIEVTPIPDDNGRERGVVGEGSVGSSLAGRFRLFRYEIRCWRGGVIPDADDRGTRVIRVTDDAPIAERVLASLSSVPKLVWGRDELRTGDMWNSNSVVSWLLSIGGLDLDAIRPPAGGRAPGWDAGVFAARRARVPEPVV